MDYTVLNSVCGILDDTYSDLKKELLDKNLDEGFSIFDAKRCIDIAMKCEKLTLFLRRKVIENYNVPVINCDLNNRLFNTSDVKVVKNGASIAIKMPPIMHITTKNMSKEGDYFKGICYPLALSLSDFKYQNDIKTFDKKVTITIRNVISKSSNRTSIPDTDNREYKDIVNTISTVFLEDDDFEHVSLNIDTVIGDETVTLILISPELPTVDCFANVCFNIEEKDEKVVA